MLVITLLSSKLNILELSYLFPVPILLILHIIYIKAWINWTIKSLVLNFPLSSLVGIMVCSPCFYCKFSNWLTRRLTTIQNFFLHILTLAIPWLLIALEMNWPGILNWVFYSLFPLHSLLFCPPYFLFQLSWTVNCTVISILLSIQFLLPGISFSLLKWFISSHLSILKIFTCLRTFLRTKTANVSSL